jgi:hypothetical protein
VVIDHDASRCTAWLRTLLHERVWCVRASPPIERNARPPPPHRNKIRPFTWGWYLRSSQVCEREIMRSPRASLGIPGTTVRPQWSWLAAWCKITPEEIQNSSRTCPQNRSAPASPRTPAATRASPSWPHALRVPITTPWTAAAARLPRRHSRAPLPGPLAAA